MNQVIKAIAIFGAPRSGTSWLGQLFNSSPAVAFRFQPLFAYAFKGRLTEESSPEEIENFHKDLLHATDDFILQRKNVSGNKIPDFKKEVQTHLVWKEVRYHYVIKNLLLNSPTKVVGIVRHPCAVINSWLNAPKEFDSAWNPLEEWQTAFKKNAGKTEEYNGYDKWKELAFLYRDLHVQNPEKFHLIKYEELNSNTPYIVKELFNFAGLEWNEQTETFIRLSQETHSNDPYGVFRANQENHSWQSELNKEIVAAILSDSDYQELDQFYKWNI